MYLLKPVGNTCNLACDYCYCDDRPTAPKSNELDKQQLFRWMAAHAQERVKISDIDILVTWHGGEPLLMGEKYFEEAMLAQDVVHSELPSISFLNQIQTNAFQISNEFMDLFRNWKVGVSISFDGTPLLHDLHRTSRDGKPTSSNVTQSIESIQNANIPLGVLAVITDDSLSSASAIYDFIKSMNIKSFSFNGAMDLKTSTPMVDVDRFGDFMVELFYLWAEDEARVTNIKFFEYIIKALCGQLPSLCKFNSKICGTINMIDSSGKIHYCDGYGTKENYKVGDLSSVNESIRNVNNLRETLNASRISCQECRWYSICGAGCPRSWGQYRKDSFCRSYQRVFEEVAPWLSAMGFKTVCS